MNKREIDAAVEAIAAPIHRRIMELAAAVERLVEQRAERRRWSDQNCGRALHPLDPDCSALIARMPSAPPSPAVRPLR